MANDEETVLVTHTWNKVSIEINAKRAMCE